MSFHSPASAITSFRIDMIDLHFHHFHFTPHLSASCAFVSPSCVSLSLCKPSWSIILKNISKSMMVSSWFDYGSHGGGPHGFLSEETKYTCANYLNITNLNIMLSLFLKRYFVVIVPIFSGEAQQIGIFCPDCLAAMAFPCLKIEEVYALFFFLAPFSAWRSKGPGLFYWAASIHRLFLYWPVSRCALVGKV